MVNGSRLGQWWIGFSEDDGKHFAEGQTNAPLFQQS